MNIARPIEHVVFPGFLQNHSLMRSGVNLTDPRVFDRYLRFNALFSRGLVVADSDLNNNEVFHHAAAYEDGLFWAALRSGYIRRAARENDAGDVLTQSDVADGLRRSSRPRWELIPEGYAARLDQALARPEGEDPPLVWTRQRLNQTFGGKLLGLLKTASANRTEESSRLRLIDRIGGWVRDRLADGEQFGAADIESRILPGLSSDEKAAWGAVWQLVLLAYVGNIPLVFGGRLAVTGFPEANDQLLPAGPESGPDESAVEARLYADPGDERGIELEVRRVRSQLPSFNVNTERLDELSLEQIEDLREIAGPGEFLATRFGTAGSAEAMAADLETLRDVTIAYLQRLASAGIVLTEEAERSVLRSQLWGPPDRDHGETQIVAVVSSPERFVEYAMLHSFPWPGGGTQVLGCDFTSLIDQVGREQAKAFFGGDIAMYWCYKRPDFRVIDLLAAGDWG
jgi:hypothetical protein